MQKVRAARNRTLTVDDTEKVFYKTKLLDSNQPLTISTIINKTICADVLLIIDALPQSFVDLLIIDPPYNLDKNFHGLKFSKRDDETYLEYLRSWFPKLIKVLKPNGSVYLCGDWQNSACLYQVMRDTVQIKNRITWQREKGRGAKTNWKNAAEDIWFGVMSNDDYYFDVDAVKQKRKVMAPYKQDGAPKDWEITQEGNFRLTHPSNFWDDLSIPYWSMPENTDHPTQKPEKLIAKLILASCPVHGIVLDPFLGSGTTSVVAKKLERQYVGIEMNEAYCLWAEKRLAQADIDKTIQGYSGGVFWERNTLHYQLAEQRNSNKIRPHQTLD
ncbi:DNA-methyltransferase [Thiospirillum jenense]|uniref:Methyltransferase n=1 Tax=Thiospirillum jenense TaxID=1653858 RepID=A0A839HGK1_9GAMM|nr:site-specific DNA-methyltransferase [Thiospirillum jenense]MBB1126207.1 site-specific DNA-methyltransferase [Thiospirillum jenense]